MTASHFSPGDMVCNCRLKQLSGVGSYGEVWLAEDAVGGLVALKIIPNRGVISERELAGLRNYRDCNHPNLLKVRYVEITPDYLFYMMDAADNLNGDGGEYVPDSLATRLRKYGRMDGTEVVAMVNGLLNGLEELHKKGLVHRDIKPDNILWVEGRPTLADAGLIAVSGKGSLVGTIGFLSPRLINGNGGAEASDDFFALGKVIYCAVTGNPVSEYPSLPKDVTISLNIHLGHAYREACKRPIKSAEEFRKLLVVNPRLATWKKIAIGCATVAILGIIGGAFYHFYAKAHQKPEYTLPAVTPVAITYSEYLKDVDSTLKYFGYDQKENQFIRLLIRYAPISKSELIRYVVDGVADTRILSAGSPAHVTLNIDVSAKLTALAQMDAANTYLELCNVVFSLGVLVDEKQDKEDYFDTFRLQPPEFPKDKKPNEVELKVAALLSQYYVEMDPKRIQAAIQKYQAPVLEFEHQGLGAKNDVRAKVHELQQKAMKEEPALRYIALDYLIHLTINHCLFEKSLTPQDEADLCQLMALQRGVSEAAR